MSPELHALLRAVDDAVGFEVPRNDYSSFAYVELAQSVPDVQAKLREVTGLQFERDGSVEVRFPSQQPVDAEISLCLQTELCAQLKALNRHRLEPKQSL